MSETLRDPRIAEGMRAQMALRQRLLDGGARQIGWKVGLGAPAMQTKCNLTAPIVGFLLDRAQLSSSTEVSLAGWHKPVAEAEIAAYIGHDLRAGADRDEVRKAIVALGPAIELADPTTPMDDVPVPTDLETNIGELVNIVRHVADIAAAVGGGLRAGQFIICGSLTPPMFLEAGERSVDFELSPIGSVSVRFSA
jgi:2-keto-4-pentenoate hydratase